MDMDMLSFNNQENEMNRIKKKITVRFFSVDTHEKFFDEFIASFHANKINENNVRIINIRNKKHFIKINKEVKIQNNDAYLISVIRERNTWQTLGLADGTISGIPLNQGIIGDPFYFIFVPCYKVILGFTTGLTGNLKSVATNTLQQFNKDRTSKITLNFITKNNEFSMLKELNRIENIHFKIKSSSLIETSDSAPEFLKDFSTSPIIENLPQLEFKFDEEQITKINIEDIILYLSESDGCNFLKLQGLNNEGQKINLDFSNAYITFKTEIQVRNKFIDENKAHVILIDALNSSDLTTLSAE
jgi:hypothetical protein